LFRLNIYEVDNCLEAPHQYYKNTAQHYIEFAKFLAAILPIYYHYR